MDILQNGLFANQRAGRLIIVKAEGGILPMFK